MKRKKPFWGRGTSWALVIAFNLGVVYALACPMLCFPQGCTERSGTSTMPGMPASHACCPAHHPRSGDQPGAPCGAPASSCINHSQPSAFLLPGGPSAARHYSAPVLALAANAPRLAIPSVTNTSPSPPGLSPGRNIRQMQSLLRI